MNESLRKKLIVILSVLVIAVVVGVVVTGTGNTVGMIAVIGGGAGCFPVLAELARMDRAAGRAKCGGERPRNDCKAGGN